ncbi:MAG: competence/damage-inducible protein A [Planctomycetota bacterium]
MPPKVVEIISVGEELLLGDTVDTNAAWLAGELAALGLPVSRISSCGDALCDIERLVLEAASRADLVVMTGGLGPTEDDRTRQALAAASGSKLVLDEKILEHIRSIFRHYGRPMAEKNSIQAMIPEGAAVIENPVGTAPGFRLRIGNAEVAAFPGVPREMKEMFRAGFLPTLLGDEAGRDVLLVRHLHVFGVGESDVDAKVADLMRPCPATAGVGLTVCGGVVTVRITARGSPDVARRLLSDCQSEIEKRLGDWIFGRDGETIEQVAGSALIRSGHTVALAESCTAGLVCAGLGAVPGISASLRGAVVAYSDDVKAELLGVDRGTLRTFGAVSAEVAGEMARGVRDRMDAGLGLSITGIAGPTGGSPEKPVGLVFFGLADAQGVRTERKMFRGERTAIQDRAAKTALNLLRLLVSGGRSGG